ncbi:MAG TPA: HIT domain-containing protein [Candidatus Binataceae bacterium]|nr:HIT domain-containing protein [Candidatus Binataceae bacterium]
MAPRTKGGKSRDGFAAPAGLRLWAPWRYSYLRRAVAGPKRCIFCLGRLTEAERKHRLVLFDTGAAVVMLNLYPYNIGHLMIAPRRHVASPELLTGEERAVVGDLVAASVKSLRRIMRPQAFNVGANLGRAAGAGFADHMHWHIVPRWEGDTNFVPVLASTRVVSQSLDETWARLRPVFKALATELS